MAINHIDKEQQDKMRQECSKEIEDFEKYSSMSCLKWPFIVFLSFLCLFIFTICSESDSSWRTFLVEVSAIIAVLSMLVVIFRACIISIGSAIGASRLYPKVASKEAMSYNLTEEEWNSLSDKEKEHRIGCIEIIWDDCGRVYEREDIINYLKGDDSKNAFRCNTFDAVTFEGIGIDDTVRCTDRRQNIGFYSNKFFPALLTFTKTSHK